MQQFIVRMELKPHFSDDVVGLSRVTLANPAPCRNHIDVRVKGFLHLLRDGCCAGAASQCQDILVLHDGQHIAGAGTPHEFQDLIVHIHIARGNNGFFQMQLFLQLTLKLFETIIGIQHAFKLNDDLAAKLCQDNALAFYLNEFLGLEKINLISHLALTHIEDKSKISSSDGLFAFDC